MAKRIEGIEDMTPYERAFGAGATKVFKGPRQTEWKVHKDICKLLREQYPKTRFYSSKDGFDFGMQRSLLPALTWYNQDEPDGTGFPDLMIFKRNKKHTMLVIELKKAGVKLNKTEHQERQRRWLDYFREQGALATFAVGYEEASLVIRNYMRLP